MSYLHEEQIIKIINELEDHLILNWNIQIDEYEDVIKDIVNELNKRYKLENSDTVKLIEAHK